MTTSTTVHIIDSNTAPVLRDGHRIGLHVRQGELKLTREGDHLFINGRKINLIRSKQHERNGECMVRGDTIRHELWVKSPLNASVGRFLFEHPELIPDSWKYDDDGIVRDIYFLCTELTSPGDHPYICYFYWSKRDTAWVWSENGLMNEWSGCSFAAALEAA